MHILNLHYYTVIYVKILSIQGKNIPKNNLKKKEFVRTSIFITFDHNHFAQLSLLNLSTFIKANENKL